MTRKASKRASSGSLLVFVIVSSGVLALLLLFCLSLGTVFFVQYRLQNALDNVALNGACKLNRQDRMGQMNNMVARCRQLVYISRKTETEMANRRLLLHKLSMQLLDEARGSAIDLEQERKQLIALSQKEAINSINEEFKKTCSNQNVLLPWLQVSKPVLIATRFGMVKDVDSNVSVLHEDEELLDFDRGQKYIDSKPDLYVQGKDLRLPSSDSDLAFTLSSLPACINNITSPARLLLPDAFIALKTERNDRIDQNHQKYQNGVQDLNGHKNQKDDNGQNVQDERNNRTDQKYPQLKSAVQIEAKVEISTSLGQSTCNSIHLLGTAATYGGAPLP